MPLKQQTYISFQTCFAKEEFKVDGMKSKTTFPAGDAQRQVPGYERPTGFLSIHMLRLEHEPFTP